MFHAGRNKGSKLFSQFLNLSTKVPIMDDVIFCIGNDKNQEMRRFEDILQISHLLIIGFIQKLGSNLSFFTHIGIYHEVVK